MFPSCRSNKAMQIDLPTLAWIRDFAAHGPWSSSCGMKDARISRLSAVVSSDVSSYPALHLLVPNISEAFHWPLFSSKSVVNWSGYLSMSLRALILMKDCLILPIFNPPSISLQSGTLLLLYRRRESSLAVFACL